MRPELVALSPPERQGVLALRCCWRVCACSRRASRPISPAAAPECGHTLLCVLSKYGWTGAPGDLQLGGRVRSVEEKLNN